ncbi:hypothetical protein BU17DRAFT_84075 [Hysterangium stoloniferum]|nr:hypothetical protein BU17DRAFT_84075 [Hysterangium stoloniferum]
MADSVDAMFPSAADPILTPSLSSTLNSSDVTTSSAATDSPSPLPLGDKVSALPETKMSVITVSSAPVRPTKEKATSTPAHVIPTPQSSPAATPTLATSHSVAASSSNQPTHSTQPPASHPPKPSEPSIHHSLQSSSTKPIVESTNQPTSPSSTPSYSSSPPSNTPAVLAITPTAANNGSVPANASIPIVIQGIVNETSITPVSYDTLTNTNLTLVPGPTPVLDSNSSTLFPPPQGIVSPSPEPSSTVVPKIHSKHGFFSEHSAVTGVFVTVTLVILAFLALLPWVLAQCRRRRCKKYAAMEPSMTMVDGPPYQDSMHYRRASQRQAFSDILSAGASANRPLSGWNTGFPSSGSNESRAGGAETYRSIDATNQRFSSTVSSNRPIPGASRQDSGGFTNGYSNVIHYPDTTSLSHPSVPPELPPKQNTDIYPELIDVPKLTNSLYPAAVNSVLRSSTHSLGVGNGSAYPSTLNTNLMADARASTSSVGSSMAYAQDSMVNSTTNSNETSSLPRYSAFNRPPPPPLPPKTGGSVIPTRSFFRPLGTTPDPKPAVQPPPRGFYAQSNPLANRSQPSMAPSSPSVYEATLPDHSHDSDSDNEDEEVYWQRRGFEKVVESRETNNARDRAMSSAQRHALPKSALGLSLGTHSNSSESTIRDYFSSDQESEIVRNMNPRAEPPWIHQVSTAPIAMPPPLRLHGGRYPLLTARTVSEVPKPPPRALSLMSVHRDL